MTIDPTVAEVVETRSAAVAEVFATWNRCGLRYAVLHGLEDYPRHIGRDLDCLVAPVDVERAIVEAEAVLSRHGFDVAHPPKIWGRRIVAFRKNAWASGLEIHAVTRVVWQSVVFATEPGAVFIRQGASVDVWASFAKAVLVPLASQGKAAVAKVVTAAAGFSEDAEALETQLGTFVGADLAARLTAALGAREPVAVGALVPELRTALRQRAWVRAPWQSAAALATQATKKVIGRFFPCGPIIALVGPDGVGKSTILKILAHGEKSVFTSIVVRHWRPGVLPPLRDLLRGRLRSSDDGVQRPPRREAGRGSYSRALYYLFDFWIGGFWRDRHDAMLQRVLLYDRCALDMAVDPLRYGIASARAGGMVWKLSAKPDLVVLLSTAAETIFRRKPELDLAEIERQLAVWNVLLARGVVHQRLDVGLPPEEVAERLRVAILEAFLRKNGGLVSPAREQHENAI